MNDTVPDEVILKALREAPGGKLDQGPKEYGLSEDQFNSAVISLEAIGLVESGVAGHFHTRDAKAVVVRQLLTLTEKGFNGEIR